MKVSGYSWACDEALAGWLLGLSGIDVGTPFVGARTDVPRGVELAKRWHDGQRLLFVLNHTDQRQLVPLDGRYSDLVRDAEVGQSAVVDPHDVLVLLEESEAHSLAWASPP